MGLPRRILLRKLTGDHGVGVGGTALLGQLLAPPGQLGAKALDAMEPGQVYHTLFQIRGQTWWHLAELTALSS